jgi:preprotein translocase subunit YajC
MENFLIATAHAQEAAGAGQQPGLFESLLPLIVLFVIFYFVLIRPQSKRAKEHKQMVEGLSRGDEVITNGGIAGRITNVGEEFVTAEIANGVEVKVQRQMVMTVLPKGSLKGE